ncbi:peptidyl-tRNA hydrolase [Shewanella sp. phage 1/40]|uniref:peptidyl-tRNA hydrolase n=1 Tax=Shewanella sp. phage 1/40 TaxID=1458860 RepID=UPI0004F6AADD|nr:peptidyl-tRNA hydrolase [Shewanella sp. phage 1/40]AHK11513.1 peptidyl-tRNA hydrolase [Shewanella sp. phage 1/40]
MIKKIKTVEYKGKVYQVGSLYQLVSGDLVYLKGLKHNGLEVSFVKENGIFRVSELFETSITCGTVTDAPVRLVVGQAYQFIYTDETFMGIYDEDGEYYGNFVKLVSAQK